jgi:hypothetical protein
MNQAHTITTGMITGKVLWSFTEKDVARAIKQIKSNKAAGPDGIFNEHIKESHQILTEAWAQLFNACIMSNKLHMHEDSKH